MTDGVVLVHGPASNNNGAIDYDESFQITGGLLVATGSSGMAQAPDATSTQYSLLLKSHSTISAGSIVHIESSSGQELLTFAPAKSNGSLVLSSADLPNGVTCNIYLYGSSSGTNTDELHQDGTYTPGTLYASFAVSRMVTTITK